MKGGDGGCLGVDYEREGIERGVVMGRTHTRHTNTGLVNWAARAVDLGRCAGAGGGSGGGDVPGIGGMGRGDDDLWAGLRNHPTTLTASWWAGYSGREGGGEGRATGRSPGADTRGEAQKTLQSKP